MDYSTRCNWEVQFPFCTNHLIQSDVTAAGKSNDFNEYFIAWSSLVPELHEFLWPLVPHICDFLPPEVKQHRVGVCEDLHQQVQGDLNFMWRIFSGRAAVSRAEDDASGQELNQEHAGGSLWHLWGWALWICPPGSDYYGWVLLWHSVASKGTLGTNDLNCGIMATGLSNMRERIWNARVSHPQQHNHRSQPLRLPDLAPCDFFLFPRINSKLTGHCFVSVEVIQHDSRILLKTLTERYFKEAFQAWQERWEQCIAAQGEYFEGKGGQVFAFYRHSIRSFLTPLHMTITSTVKAGSVWFFTKTSQSTDVDIVFQSWLPVLELETVRSRSSYLPRESPTAVSSGSIPSYVLKNFSTQLSKVCTDIFNLLSLCEDQLCLKKTTIVFVQHPSLTLMITDLLLWNIERYAAKLPALEI